MSLSRKIAAALDAATGPGVVSAQDGACRIELHIEAGGPVGVAFSYLEFASQDHTDWTSEALKAWGDRIAARVTYLMESLVVIEVDPVGGEVDLRSQSPSTRNGQRTYYEVRMNRQGTLRFGRVAFNEQTRRRSAVPCHLTREVIERLTDDLVATLR
jgi:hypothetical protein